MSVNFVLAGPMQADGFFILLLHAKLGPKYFRVTCTSPNMSPEPSLEQKQEINYTKS
jgi:hypothetical protein